MKSDFTFSKDDSKFYLPFHIGMMVALAGFFLLLIVSLGQWVGSHKGDYRENLSVLIPATIENPDSTSVTIHDKLAARKEISSIKKISDEELLSSLQPWLDSDEKTAQLALPVIFEIKLKKEAIADENYATTIEVIKKTIKDINPAITLETNNSWTDLFAAFINIIQILALILTFTVLGAMTMVIMLSARASLHFHENTVNLLHEIGAEDDYIAKQFQHEQARICLAAAFGGVVCALILYISLSWWIANLGNSLLPQLELSSAHLIIAAALPFLCLIIVITATRYSILSQLKKML